MNIFLRELKANMKSLLIWCGAQFFVIFAGMIKYSAFKSTSVDINSIFEALPKGLKAMFGIGEIDLTKIEGYYTIFFLFFMLLAGIHAVMLGVVLIAKEERDHSADFLFVKPVTRTRVITAKLAAGLVNVIAFNLLTMASSLYFIALYNDGNPLTDKVMIMMGALIILQVLFLSLGAVLGAMLRTAKLASSAASAILLGTFFISVGISLDSRIEFLKYMTPFNFFEAKSLMFGGSFQAWSFAVSAVLIAVFLFFTYRQFGQRDLAI